MSEAKEIVVVLGASSNPERYSNKAVCLLLEYGHEVIPIHPGLKSIQDLPVMATLGDIPGDKTIDTLTVYVSAAVSSQLGDAISSLNPARLIFNPGAENPKLSARLKAEGIAVEEACTLVLLRTGQF